MWTPSANAQPKSSLALPSNIFFNTSQNCSAVLNGLPHFPGRVTHTTPFGNRDPACRLRRCRIGRRTINCTGAASTSVWLVIVFLSRPREFQRSFDESPPRESNSPTVRECYAVGSKRWQYCERTGIEPDDLRRVASVKLCLPSRVHFVRLPLPVTCPAPGVEAVSSDPNGPFNVQPLTTPHRMKRIFFGRSSQPI